MTTSQDKYHMLKQSYLALWTKESVPFFKQLPYFLQRLKELCVLPFNNLRDFRRRI